MPKDNEATSPAVYYLIDQLEKLVALPLTTDSELDRWNAEADKVEKALRDVFPEFELPDVFRHFLADPDIRLRDKEYLEYQNQRITSYIARLRQRTKSDSR